jgi:Lon protease-like protein
MSEELLPLFPLQVVLLPGATLPLHIFEERYKTLIGECMAQHREFGINFVNGETFSEVGCTARVKDVLRRYDDGRMDIIVEGKNRYVLQKYESGRAPYLVGYVHRLNSAREQVDRALALDTVRLYNQLVAIVYKGTVEQVAPDRIESGLSYLLAQKAGMEVLQRQRLLETPSENDRLEALHSYFTEVIPKLEKMEEIERVVKSDGYL